MPRPAVGAIGWSRECVPGNKWVNEKNESLLIFDYIILGLGESQLSFKLTYLFPDSLQACARPIPYPSNPFPRLNTFCLWSPFWLLLHMPQEEFLLYCLFLFLIFWVSEPVAPKEDQKVSPSFLHEAMGGGKDVNFLGRDSAIPWEFWSCNFQTWAWLSVTSRLSQTQSV